MRPSVTKVFINACLRLYKPISISNTNLSVHPSICIASCCRLYFPKHNMSSKTDEEKPGKKSGKDRSPSPSSGAAKVKEEAEGSSTEKRDSKDESPERTKHVTRGRLQKDHKQEVTEAREKFLSMDIKSKRELYKCKSKYVVLDDIQTWPEYFSSDVKDDKKMSSWWKANSKKVKVDVNDDLNKKMSLFRGDITSLEIDAIANAANESLLGGGGVDGAIHNAAGSLLRSECETLNGCDPGDAKISCGYKLPAKYIVHTVGPRGERPEVLKNCYLRSLNLLKEHNLKSIAFPCISTGIFGYPNANAANVALSTIREWLEKEEYAKNVDRIIMCLFLPVDVNIYKELMQLYFPLDRSTNTSDNRKKSESESSGSDSSDNASPKAKAKAKDSSDDEDKKAEDKTPKKKKSPKKDKAESEKD